MPQIDPTKPYDVCVTRAAAGLPERPDEPPAGAIEWAPGSLREAIAPTTVWAWARWYCQNGFALTWTPVGQKGPRHGNWQLRENAIVDPEDAERYWSYDRTRGIACLLKFSRLVSLDIDDPQHAPGILSAFGIDLQDLILKGPGVVGRPGRIRLLFRAPDDLLVHRTAKWPDQADLQKSSVLFELRAGPIADMLPPTTHPDTGQPYRWSNWPGDGIFPLLPQSLLDLWLDWARSEQTIWALCPWAPVRRKEQLKRTHVPSGTSVIDWFNASYDIPAILAKYGYRRSGSRFMPPNSQHAPGLVLLDDGHVFSHHAGDVLADGRAHDAFSVWAQLEHGGDVSHAVRIAARLRWSSRNSS